LLFQQDFGPEEDNAIFLSVAIEDCVMPLGSDRMRYFHCSIRPTFREGGGIDGNTVDVEAVGCLKLRVLSQRTVDVVRHLRSVLGLNIDFMNIDLNGCPKTLRCVRITSENGLRAKYQQLGITRDITCRSYGVFYLVIPHRSDSISSIIRSRSSGVKMAKKGKLRLSLSAREL